MLVFFICLVFFLLIVWVYIVSIKYSINEVMIVNIIIILLFWKVLVNFVKVFLKLIGFGVMIILDLNDVRWFVI